MSCRILPEENALIYECLVEPIGDVSVDTLKNLLAIHKTNGKHFGFVCSTSQTSACMESHLGIRSLNITSTDDVVRPMTKMVS